MAQDNFDRELPEDQPRPPVGRKKSPTSPRRVRYLVHLLVLGILLIAPGWAVARLSAKVELTILLGVATGISIIAFVLHAVDKRRARQNKWRISESTLHAFELLGGWPGAFLAQRIFRHKTAKWGYQITFWIVVLLHQFVAIDYVLDWPLSQAALEWVRPAQAGKM